MRNKIFANGFLILALIMSATASLLAQNYRDSLLNLLTPDLDNDAKARIYCNIAKYENDPDTINKYARLAEESVSDSTDIKAEAISYRAYVLYNEMNYEKSLQLYREAFELCKNSNKKSLSNKMSMNQGCCLEAMENIAGALEKYSEALERSRQLGDTTIILWIYENMCTICSEAKIFRLAEGYSNMALALCKASQSPDQLVIAYEIKAQMLFVKSFTSHGHERDSLLREATIYCDSVKNIVERTKCADFECLSALNEVNLIKCKIYLYQANKKNNKAYSDTARKYLTLYENWSHELRDSTAQYIIYLHTAEYYYINGEYKKSLAISENINDAAITKKYDKVALYKLISDTYFKLKQYDKSHLWEEKLLALANDGTESRILSQIAESHIQQTNQIMQRNAELDKQQRQQEYQQDINDKKNKLKMLIVALCFCFVLVIVALFYVRRKRTMSRILETKNSALLQKQRHRTKCDLVGPKEEQAVAESRVLHDHRQNRHEYICLDREGVVHQAGLFETLLPVAEPLPEGLRHAEGFDRIKIIEGFDLEGGHAGADLLHLLRVFALLADQVLRHEKHDRRRREGDQGHDLVVMPDDDKCQCKIIECDDDGGKPADGVLAHGRDVGIEAVQDVSARVGVDRLPVHVNDLVEDVRLDVVVDIDGKLC